MNTRHVLSKASEFVPRTAFPAGESIPRSYFLGHHRVGLSKMKTMLSSIDLVIECRDYRLPITSRNPLFEESLAGRQRLIVYTKKDLGSNGLALDRSVRNMLSDGLGPPLLLCWRPERIVGSHMARE